MKTYGIEIERDGRWWMVSIPALNGLTQARRLEEAALMGREWIALETDAKLDDVAVEITGIRLEDGTDVLRQRAEVSAARQQAEAAAARLAEVTKSVAKLLVDHGVPVRDAGEAIGVSAQRISQLARP